MAKQPKRTKQRTEEDNSGLPRAARARSQFEPGPWNPFIWVSKAHRRGSNGAPLIRWPWQNKDEF